MVDKEILLQLKQKDPRALEEIIKEYHKYVFKIVYTILNGYAAEIDIRGVVNQIFFQLWQNAEKLDIEKYEDIKPYLGMIAKNMSIDERKKLNKCLPLEEEILGHTNELLTQVELKEILSKALKELSPENQIILLKFYFQGKSIKQIANEERLPEATIKTKLKRSREKLKRILEKGGFVYED